MIFPVHFNLSRRGSCSSKHLGFCLLSGLFPACVCARVRTFREGFSRQRRAEVPIRASDQFQQELAHTRFKLVVRGLAACLIDQSTATTIAIAHQQPVDRRTLNPSTAASDPAIPPTKNFRHYSMRCRSLNPIATKFMPFRPTFLLAGTVRRRIGFAQLRHFRGSGAHLVILPGCCFGA